MAVNSTAIENYSSNSNFDDLDAVELLEYIDSSLVMSLLEEGSSQVVEDYKGDDHERSLMRNICEPEIYSSSDDYSEDYRCSDFEEMESCSTSPDHHLGFEWMDMEMADSSPFDEMMNTYFIGRFTETTTMVDYSQVCYYGMPVDEEEVDYIDLWQ